LIDGSTRPNIQTASSDTVILTLGRDSSGLVKNALVDGKKVLAKNLVSIPSLDRVGYTTTFANGEGVVSFNCNNKKIIKRARSSQNYQICLQIQILINYHLPMKVNYPLAWL
jgi:hypothetical protein